MPYLLADLGPEHILMIQEVSADSTLNCACVNGSTP